MRSARLGMFIPVVFAVVSRWFRTARLMQANRLLTSHPVSASLRFPFAYLANRRRKPVRTPDCENDQWPVGQAVLIVSLSA